MVGVVFFSFFILLFGLLTYKKMPDAKKVRRTLADELMDNLKDTLKVSNKLKNNDIKEIFTFINEEFDKVSEERNEPKLDGSQKLKILKEVLNVADMTDREFAIKHLHYELNRFREYGIREDNKKLIYRR